MITQRRDANDSIADGLRLEDIARMLGIRRQSVWRLEQNAIRKIWRRQLRRKP